MEQASLHVISEGAVEGSRARVCSSRYFDDLLKLRDRYLTTRLGKSKSVEVQREVAAALRNVSLSEHRYDERLEADDLSNHSPREGGAH